MQHQEFRLIVCGGRDFTDRAAAFAALDRADARRYIDVIVHGGQRGADTLGGMWAAARKRRCIVFPADWSLGPRGGPERNQRMVDEGLAGGVLALPGGRGTADMIRRAEAAGLPVWRPYG